MRKTPIKGKNYYSLVAVFKIFNTVNNISEKQRRELSVKNSVEGNQWKFLTNVK